MADVLSVALLLVMGYILGLLLIRLFGAPSSEGRRAAPGLRFRPERRSRK